MFEKKHKAAFVTAALGASLLGGVPDDAQARKKNLVAAPQDGTSLKECKKNGIKVSDKNEGIMVVVFNLHAAPENRYTVLCSYQDENQKNWASLTKVLAWTVFMEAIKSGKLDLNSRIPITPESLALEQSNFAKRWLSEDMQSGHGTMLVSEALTHHLHSSNIMSHNMAVATARAMTGNQNMSPAAANQWVVDRMMQKAKEWGMDKTSIRNVTGLPEGNRQGQYSTAVDVAKMIFHTLHMFRDYQTYAARPITADGVVQQVKPTATELAKREVMAFGAVGKSGTINGCGVGSYTGWKVNPDLTGTISTRLCAPTNPPKRVLEDLKTAERFISSQSGQSPVPHQYPSPTLSSNP